MSDTIICIPVLQPPAYGRDPSRYTVAVSLNFAYRAGHDSPSPTEAHAEERFESFLQALLRATFRVYRLTGGTSSPAHYLEPAEWTVTEEATPSGATPTGKIIDWLQYQKDKAKAAEFWVSTDPTVMGSPASDYNVKVKSIELQATHFLGASAAWPAPLAQDAGLVRILTLTPAIASPPHFSPPHAPPAHTDVPHDLGQLIIVPFFDEVDDFQPHDFTRTSYQGKPHSFDLIQFTYDAGAGFSEATAEVRFIDAGAMSARGLMDIDNGFLVAPNNPKDADKVAAILKLIQNRSASLLWAFPAIQAFDWSAKDAPRHSPPAEITRLVWRAMNGIATLLDPVVVSLIMPAPGDPQVRSNPNPDGPFIAALAACVAQAWAERSQRPAAAPDTAGLSGLVEKALRSNLLLDNENDAGKRNALVKLLIKCLGIKDNNDIKPVLVDPKGAVTNAPSFIWLLMRCYADVAPGAWVPGLIENATGRFGSNGNPATLEKALSNELAGLAQQLQADDGIERLALNLLDAVGILDNSGKGIGIADAELARLAISQFRMRVSSNFNALDAVRHAQAQLYELYLVKAAASAGTSSPERTEHWSAKDLKEAITQADWFAQRVDRSARGTFGRIARVLPIYAASTLATDDAAFVRNQLKDLFKTVGDDLLPPPPGEQRFVPDAAPRSLQLQIGVDNNLEDYENFVHAYSGLGVLVRRAGRDWSYADLAILATYRRKANTTRDYDEVTEPGSPGTNLISVLPLQPAVVDDRYSLFLSYDGLPFTSRAFVDTRASGTNVDQVLPFFSFDDPAAADLKANNFARLSPLAYGTTYDVAAFVIGKGGALPHGIQALTLPWMPGHAPQIPPDANGKTYARSYPYRRTTAIGRVALSELTPGGTGQTKRIGAGIDGVQPLSSDYPRVGLVAAGGQPSTLDLFRNADGTGAFSPPQPVTRSSSPPLSSPPPAGNTTNITLSDLWWWGGPGTLTLSVFARADVLPKDLPETAWTFAIRGPFAGASLTLNVSRADDFTLSLTCTLVDRSGRPLAPATTHVIADAKSIWLRLGIASSSTPPQQIAFSLADPSAAGGQMTARHAADSLVLVAPQTSEWRSPYTQPVIAHVNFPRVTFNDFDRWLNNPNLASEAMASIRNQPPSQADKDRFKKFRLMLMTAYLARHFNPKLATLVDSLPDLAVDRLLIELTPLDALYDEPTAVVTTTSQWMGAVSLTVQLDTLGARLLPPMLDGLDMKTVGGLVACLSKLDGLCATSVQIKSIDHGKLAINSTPPGKEPKVITVTIPRGMVARLTIRPMVSAHYFANEASPPGVPMFDDDFATLATEKRDGHYVFEGASLVIESMLGALASPPASPWSWPWMDTIAARNNRSYEWENLAAKAVGIDAGAHRSYGLIARPKELAREPHGWWWRQLSGIDVQTQRWRFAGRPIYSWLDPQKGARPDRNGQKAGSPADVAVEQGWNNNDNGVRRDAIMRFESEIFFDRDDADSDSRAAQLGPAPNETILQSFPWEQPSATYFRHRLTIHSRYEGALAAGQIAVLRAWGEDSDFNDVKLRKNFGRSWIRVAMLADRTRLQLTRPQLRALIPLTVAPVTPDDDTPAATPPVMAILDERPFAHGGLADRIATEIRTGFGYELPAARILEIADARKEFGPDPRLTYTPTREDHAQAMTLRNEGPVGLTFDSSNVRAAVYANTALVLHPTRLTSDAPRPASMEEHFLSVGLRRYLDPAWLTAEAISDYTVATPLWITWDIDDPDQWFSLGVQGTVQSRDLITVTQEGGIWSVEFDAALIDLLPQQNASASPPMGSPALSPPPNFKKLCAVYAGAITGLTFLHLPLEKGRASLSVFAQPSAVSASLGDFAVRAGDANQPLMMASFEWQMPVGTTSLTFDDEGTGKTSVSRTSASPTTLMNWTRTGRNFELWHATKGGDFCPYSVSNLVVRWADNGKTKRAFFDARDPVTDAKGNQAASLSFEPHSSRYVAPLYVHRHHAIVATRNAGGIGRPVEVYMGIARVFGGAFSLPKNSAFVRLVEFETPARPLVWLPPSTPSSSALQTLKAAHFDLPSIWGNAETFKGSGSPADPGLSLFIRPLGGKAANSGLTQLVLQLHVLLPNSATMNNTITVNVPASPAPVRGIMLIVTNIGPNPSVGCEVFHVGGAVDKFQAGVTRASGPVTLDPTPAVELSITNVFRRDGVQAEFWTDVSLLTLPYSHDPDGFTFDWLFTGEVQPPADAIKESGLQQMVEAQARIIAVSPPIRVEA
ncbi:hypothetical protein ABIF69_005904 [Bradyrhizobium japonicum]